VRYAHLPARGTVEAASRCEIMALLLPLIVLAAFFLLRNPQRRRAQSQKALLESLRPGTRVATVAGVIGTLVGTEGDRAAIEIAPGVIVEFLLASITRTIDEPEPPLGLDVADGHEPLGHDAAGHDADGHEALDLDAAGGHDARDLDAAGGHDALDLDGMEGHDTPDEDASHLNAPDGAAPHHEET